MVVKNGSRNRKRGISWVSVFVMSVVSGQLLADNPMITKIDRILVDPYGGLGGCAIWPQLKPQDELPGCGNNWLTLDCEGELGTTSRESSNLLTTVQMAYALDKALTIYVNPNQTIDGKCSINQLQLR